MNRIKTLAVTIVMLILGTNAYADNPSATEILNKVTATYKTMKSYKAKGTITSVTEYKSSSGKAEFSFSILLKKPNMYIITWNQTNLRPREVYSCVLWSDGTQRYLLNKKVNFLYKFANDEIALRAARFSGGPVYIIPTLLLPVLNENDAPFSWLKNQKVENIERIGDEDCYVISGTSATSKRETIWISNKNYLIRKYYRELDYLKMLKQRMDVTNEEREYIGEWLKKYKSYNSYTEIYKEISSSELRKEDFSYTLPEGVKPRNWSDD